LPLAFANQLIRLVLPTDVSPWINTGKSLENNMFHFQIALGSILKDVEIEAIFLA
jgi:hypothetical protein